jgi:hypothetical protein
VVRTRNPEIDWEADKLLTLQCQLGDTGKETSTITVLVSDIQTLSAAAFETCSQLRKSLTHYV